MPMIVLTLPNESQSMTLLESARAGDKRAIGSIYNLYFESIYQFIRFRVSDTQIAEDITSDVFVAMIQAFKNRKGPRNNLRAWLFRVARNKIADHYGKQESLPLETIEEWFADDQPNLETQFVNSLTKDTVRELVGQLSLDQQSVLLFRFNQQLSLQETADIMGKNVNTVKTLQARAVKKLAKLAERSLEDG